MHSGVCCFSDKQHINGLHEVRIGHHGDSSTGASFCPRPSFAAATLDRHTHACVTPLPAPGQQLTCCCLCCVPAPPADVLRW